MKNPKQKRVWTAFLAGILFLLLAGVAAAGEQQRKSSAAATSGPEVRLSSAQAASLEKALNTLAAQGKVAFVAEGSPLRATLPPDEAAELAASSGEAAPLAAIVEKLALAYDYDATLRSNVFVFKKRYTDPHDLPGLTLEECQLSLQDVVRVLNGFSPPVKTGSNGSTGEVAWGVIASLSAQQIDAMKGQPLSVNSLSAQQQVHLRRLNSYMYAGRAGEEAKNVLAGLKSSPTATLREENQSGRTLFGYESSNVYNQRVFRPLGNPNGGVVFTDAGPVTDNSAPDALTLRKQATAPNATTLGAVADALNARPGSVARYAVEKALAAKPIVVVGEANAAPSQVFAALAQAYGLRVRTGEDKTQTLTRRAVRVPRDFRDLPTEVRRALPEPLLRALHDGELAELVRRERQRQEHEDPTAVPPSDAERRKTSQDRYRLGKIGAALSDEAARRLRLHVEPLLDEEGSKTGVPVAELAEPERAEFALALLEPFLDRVTLGHLEPPPTLTQFDRLYLSASQGAGEDGKPRFSLALGTPNADGKTLIPLLSISNIAPSRP